jgi:hypothetical protein
LKKIFIILILTISFVRAENGMVDVNVLLIKKSPSDKSVKLGYYEKDEIINILSNKNGIDNDDIWYETKKGFVRKKYVIPVPTQLTIKEVDINKFAIQLIVYNKKALRSLKYGIRLLSGESDFYLEQTKKANVLFLVNFDSFKQARNKLDNLKHFKGFITTMKLHKVNTILYNSERIESKSKKIFTLTNDKMNKSVNYLIEDALIKLNY